MRTRGQRAEWELVLAASNFDSQGIRRELPYVSRLDARSGMLERTVLHDLFSVPASACPRLGEVTEIVRLLLDAGARLNDADAQDATPLHAAQRQGYLAIPEIRRLINRHYDDAGVDDHVSLVEGSLTQQRLDRLFGQFAR